MNQPVDQRIWWELHLRKARGESLSEQEERFYAEEVSRQDQEAAPLTNDFASLMEMRAKFLVLRGENRDLRKRISEIEEDICGESPPLS